MKRERILYNASEKPVRTIRIPNGCADFAAALGIPARDTYWDYNLVCPPGSGLEFPDRHIGASHQSITALVRGEANGLTLKLYDGFLQFQQAYAGVGSIVELAEGDIDGNIFRYPRHSVPQSLLETVQRKSYLRALFNGKVLATPFPTKDVQRVAERLGARTLIGAEQAVAFNSKSRVLTEAASIGYNVSPHAVIRNWEELDTGFAALCGQAAAFGLDPNRTRYWIKLDSLGAGMGVRPFDLREESFTSVKSWLSDSLNEAGVAWTQGMPVLIDIDVGALPEVKRVAANTNVQAVVTPDAVRITGTTFQKVSATGAYQGGRLPHTDKEKAHALSAQPWALPVLEAARLGGYRGYAGVDILLCDLKDGGQCGYVLEMNGRINSSTSLLSFVHWVEDQSGVKSVAGENLSGYFKPLADFRTFENAFSKVLFRGADTGYSGIVPVVMKPDEQGRIHGVKAVATAPDAAGLRKVERRFNAVLEALKP